MYPNTTQIYIGVWFLNFRCCYLLSNWWCMMYVIIISLVIYLSESHIFSFTSYQPEARATMKSPKRAIMKAGSENKEQIDNDGSCFSPRSLFALPPDGSSLMLDSFDYANENSDQDLLLDVPSHSSFPQAELLCPISSYNNTQKASTNTSSIYPHLIRPWHVC